MIALNHIKVQMSMLQRKEYVMNMLGSISHQKSVFIIYLLEDEQELSLGTLIRLQRIYNFYRFMLLYYHSWMFYNHFIATLYHFLGLTY